MDPPRTLLVAPDNETLVQLGAACRERLPAAVLDRQTEAKITILTGVKTMRKADLKRAARYEPGDVICWAKASTLGGRGHVECREYTEVLAIDAIQNRLTVRTAAGDVTYTASAAQGEVYSSAKRTFAVGETIRLTKPWGPPGNKVANGAMGRIVEMNEQGQGKLQFGEKTYHWDIRSNPHLDWGYATTSYRGQSLTFDRVGVHIDTGNSRIRGLVDKVLGYVAFSRAAKELLIVTDDKAELLSARSPLLKWFQKPTALPIVQQGERQQIKRYSAVHRPSVPVQAKIHEGVIAQQHVKPNYPRIGI